eukprot:11124018-Lingulodinium_polyedra.AAC.1
MGCACLEPPRLYSQGLAAPVPCAQPPPALPRARGGRARGAGGIPELRGGPDARGRGAPLPAALR